MITCLACGQVIEPESQPSGSGYGWTHEGGTRFCSGSKLVLARPAKLHFSTRSVTKAAKQPTEKYFQSSIRGVPE